MHCHSLASAFMLNRRQHRTVIVRLLSLEETLTNNTISNVLQVQGLTYLPWLCHLSRTSRAQDEATYLFIKTDHPKVLPLLLEKPPCIGVRPELWRTTRHFGNYPEAVKQFLHFTDRKQSGNNLSSSLHIVLEVEPKPKCQGLRSCF